MLYMGTFHVQAIPLRVDAGDIIMISNSEFIRQTIKIATGSEVSFLRHHFSSMWHKINSAYCFSI